MSTLHTSDYLTHTSLPNHAAAFCEWGWVRINAGGYNQAGEPCALGWGTTSGGARGFLLITGDPFSTDTGLAALIFRNGAADADAEQILTGSDTGWLFWSLQYPGSGNDYLVRVRRLNETSFTSYTLNCGAPASSGGSGGEMRVGSNQFNEHQPDCNHFRFGYREAEVSTPDLYAISLQRSGSMGGTNLHELDLDSATNAGDNLGTGTDWTVTGTLQNDTDPPAEASPQAWTYPTRVFAPKGVRQRRVPPFWPPSAVPRSTKNAVVINAYSITGDPGSLTLSGTAAGLAHGHNMPAAVGSLTLTGTSSVLAHGSKLVAEPGALTLTGSDASLAHVQRLSLPSQPRLVNRLVPPFWPPSRVPRSSQSVRILTADPASLALSGTATSLEWGHALVCTPGALALSGTAAGLAVGRRLVCTPGTLTLSGTATTLVRGRPMVADVGSLTLTGTTCTLTRGRPMVCTPGSLVLSGTTTRLAVQYKLVCAAGSLTLTGTNTALVYSGSGSRTLAAESGALALTGTTAGIAAQRKLACSPGSLALSGAAAAVHVGRNLPAAPGSLTLAGTTTGTRKAWRLTAESGALAFSGTTATLTYSGSGSKTITADPGALTLSGTAATVRKASRLALIPGGLTLNGNVVALHKGLTLAAAAAALLIAGQDVTLRRTYTLSATSGALALNGTNTTLQYGTAYHRAPEKRVAIFGGRPSSRIARF